MLNAILEGKAGRIMLDADTSQSWRAVFKSHEDLLTAAIWTRINYLSPPAMAKFLSNLLKVNIDNWGAFESIAFWPRYTFPESPEGKMGECFFKGEQFSEPDLVMTFENTALIVEVKPPSGGIQNKQQWWKELYTYLEDDNAKESIHFLALGNLPAASDRWFCELKEQFPQVNFYGSEWGKVREIFQSIEWEAVQDQRIITDCLKALTLYGISDPLLSWSLFHQFLTQTPLPSDFSFLKEQK